MGEGDFCYLTPGKRRGGGGIKNGKRNFFNETSYPGNPLTHFSLKVAFRKNVNHGVIPRKDERERWRRRKEEKKRVYDDKGPRECLPGDRTEPNRGVERAIIQFPSRRRRRAAAGGGKLGKNKVVFPSNTIAYFVKSITAFGAVITS